MRPLTEEDNQGFMRNIGSQVVKLTGRPFKSKKKFNTVVGFCSHIQSRHLCYTFLEDDSIVECFRCTSVID